MQLLQNFSRLRYIHILNSKLNPAILQISELAGFCRHGLARQLTPRPKQAKAVPTEMLDKITGEKPLLGAAFMGSDRNEYAALRRRHTEAMFPMLQDLPC